MITAIEPLPATIERSGAAMSFRIFSTFQETLATKHKGTLMTGARLKHYGWGREGEGMTGDERNFVLGRYHEKFATDAFDTINVPPLDALTLRAPRLTPPASIAQFCSTEVVGEGSCSCRAWAAQPAG